jgi:ribonucleotide reductase alpha subunit
MFVVKRDGTQERFQFDKITTRLQRLTDGLSGLLDPAAVAQKVIATLYSGVTTTEVDEQAARVAAQMVNHHPDYGVLAGRLLVAELHRYLPSTFVAVLSQLYTFTDPVTKQAQPLISEELWLLAQKHADRLNEAIKLERDLQFSYFGFMTLKRSYLLKINNKSAESPQHMYLRVAMGIHGDHIDDIIATYDLLSQGIISHASPTMFNAGTNKPQMASCFLLSMDGDQDSIKSIYSTLGKCADISKYAGGIGLHVHTVRAAGAYISGTNGTSNGLVPMLKVFNATAKYVDQGGNKRPGAFAIYLEPWHGDIVEFLDLKLQTGVEELRARDLFYGLWVPDLFMERVRDDQSWTLMDPHTAPGLSKVWGDKFKDLYERYEREGRGLRTMPARTLWARILRTQKETGTPYMLFKDHANRKSNQQHLGTIESSNLCVAGDTMILTKTGPLTIKELVDGPDTTAHGEGHDAYHKTLHQIKDLEQRAHTTSEGKPDADLKSELVALQAKLASLPRPAVESKPHQIPAVEVWNGHEWSSVVPAQTATHVKLMRVTTSHGTQLDCTLTHKFILEDGVTRVDAHNLTLGQRLARVTHDTNRPVIYPGQADHALPDDVAFRRGFVYAYAIQKKGTETVGGSIPQFKVPMLLLTKEHVSGKTLEYFNYQLDWARSTFDNIDHEQLAACAVPTADQHLQTRLTGPISTRESWVKGFLAGLYGVLKYARGSYAFLHKPWLMLRSVGQAVVLRPADNKGLWELHGLPHDDDGVPVVTGLQILPGSHNTYCFTESHRNAGVFNELLTGQCAEIIEYSDPNQIAVCNLASLCLNKFVVNGEFDFARLHAVTQQVTINMNRIIDRNLYLLEEMRESNLRYRPIGIGVQGLADVFAQMHYAWESLEAQTLNKDIFETIYHAALTASNRLAQHNKPYEGFWASPAAEGRLQFDLWNQPMPTRYDWGSLKASIILTGLYNSLLLTCMPTASTAQILGNNESIEPFTSNMYTRSVLSGEFQVVNKYLVQDLLARNLWEPKMVTELIKHNGSVQQIAAIPDDLKAVYKTVWEIPQRVLIDMAADRGQFICQSQSFNLHMRDPSNNQLHNALFYAWEKGLKTGMYYLRTRPAVDPIKFTVAPDATDANADAAMAQAEEILACSRANPGACVMCSS